MNKYTIYCTEEQTKKALELGAPLIFIDEGRRLPEHCVYIPKKWGYYAIPTAEQMMRWLEKEENIQIIITARDKGWWYFQLMKNWNFEEMESGYEEESYKEVILAAIDTALDYLKK